MFLTGFLLLINFVLGELRFYPHDDCDFYTKLTCQNVTLYNPQWPAAYRPGMMCRWIYDCPIWHTCLLQCRDLGLPQTRGCYMDKLLVSQSGDPFVSDADMYCGQDVINYKSIGTKIVIALITHPLSPGGRFICTLRAELWSHRLAAKQNLTLIAHRKKTKKSQRKKSKKKKGNTRLAPVPQENLNYPKITRIEHKQKIIQHSNHTKIDHGEYIHAKLQHGKYINTILQENKHKRKRLKHQHAKHCGLHIKISSHTETPDSAESNNETDEQIESSTGTHKQIEIQKQIKSQQEKRICKQMKSATKLKQIKSYYKRFAKVKPYGRCEEIDPLYEDQQAESLIETQQIDFPNRKLEVVKSQYKTYKPPKSRLKSIKQVDILGTEYNQAQSPYRDPELAEPMYRLLAVAEPQNLNPKKTETPQINSQTETQQQAESQIRETMVEVSEPTELLRDNNDECATSQQGMIQTNSQPIQSKPRRKKKKHKKLRYTEKEKQDQGHLMFKWNLQNDLMKKMQIHADVTYEGHATTTSKTVQKDMKFTPSPEIKRLQEKLSDLVAKSFKSMKDSPKRASINFKYVKKIIKVVRSVQRRRRTVKKNTKEDMDKHNASLVIN